MLHATLLAIAASLSLHLAPAPQAELASAVAIQAAPRVEFVGAPPGAESIVMSPPLALDASLVAALPISVVSGMPDLVLADGPVGTFRCGDLLFFNYNGNGTGNACDPAYDVAVAKARAKFVKALSDQLLFVCEFCPVPGDCQRYLSFFEGGWRVTEAVKVMNDWCVTVTYAGAVGAGCSNCLL